jgi:hypothetical protein
MVRGGELRATAMLVLFSGLVAAFLLYRTIFMPGPGYDYNFGYLYGRDFPNFWAGGIVALSGKVAILTDLDAYNDWLHQMFGGDVGRRYHYIFSYLPNVLPLLAPLGLMGYAAALYAYTAVSLALAAVLGWWLSGRVWFAGLLMALSPGLLATVFNGHPGMFLAALLVPGLLLSRRRPVLAGLLLGLATVKPQLGLLIALILVIDLNWRAILAAVASAAALAALSLALYGSEPWIAYFAVIAPKQVAVLQLIYDRNLIYFIPTPFAIFTWLRLPFAWAQGLQMVCGLLAAAAAVYVWLKSRDEALRTLAVILATALLLPYFNNYDLTMLALAQVVFLYRSPLAMQMTKSVHVVLWTAAALSPLLAVIGVPVGALGLVLGLVVVVALARRGESV